MLGWKLLSCKLCDLCYGHLLFLSNKISVISVPVDRVSTIDQYFPTHYGMTQDTAAYMIWVDNFYNCISEQVMRL